jgi:hypothetical protein
LVNMNVFSIVDACGRSETAGISSISDSSAADTIDDTHRKIGTVDRKNRRRLPILILQRK